MKNITTILIFTICSVLAINAQTQPIKINFQAVVGDKAFDCSETYDGIGTTNSKMTVSDFRFFVHNVRLIDNKGKETPINLEQDGKYQSGNIALLDFENGQGNCKNGTTELNTAIRGTVAKGKYVGVKFTIGVPEEENHKDPSLQPAPLNVTRMMWSWQSGYKFIRIDTKTTGRANGYVLHLGSTGCKTDSATAKTVCSSANRPEMTFGKFNLENESIKVDLKALYANANVDINQDKTAAGCMSSLEDSDCQPVFKSLGLAFGNEKPVSQTFLSVGKSPKSAQPTANKPLNTTNTKRSE